MKVTKAVPTNPIQERLTLLKRLLDLLHPYFGQEFKVTREVEEKVTSETVLLRKIQNSPWYHEVVDSSFFADRLGITKLGRYEKLLSNASETSTVLGITSELLSRLDGNIALLNLILKG